MSFDGRLSFQRDFRYRRINDFKKRVLNAPIADINSSTQYKLSYEVTKTGRSVTGFDFTMDCREIVAAEDTSAEVMKLEKLPRKAKQTARKKPR